ncbi:MAG: hypothetical protein J3K34DRAFT_525626 [Monoraphidium minutum]|nr:MAG: hypothetical protein J3K34DRAFT_525626 [Monoraphidium minutum]
MAAAPRLHVLLLLLLLLLAARAARGSRTGAGRLEQGAPAPEGAQQLRHHVLMLTNKEVDGWALGFMKKILQGYDIPFTVAVFGAGSPAPPPDDLDELLWADKGAAGRFSALVMYPDLEALSAVSNRQMDAIKAYQVATGARMLKWGVWGQDLGYAGVAFKECSEGLQAVELLPGAPLGLSGVNPKAPLATEEMYRCPGIEGAPARQTCVYPKAGPPACSPLAEDPVPFLRLAPNASLGAPYAAPTVGGALLKYADGRRVMGITFDCSEAYIACWPLGHLGVSWVMQDLIPGQRRALLSLQVDDIFLTTRLNGKPDRYRVAAADVQAHAAWQRRLNARLPAGSDVKLDMVYNGNGVLEKIYSPAGAANTPSCHEQTAYRALDCSCFGKAYADCPATAPPFCRNCTKTWEKPLGSFGVGLAAGAPADWDGAALLARDDLYRLVKGSPEVKDAFHWTGHMFSHQARLLGVLDNVTYEGVTKLVTYNQIMAAKEHLDIADRPTYTRKVVVPPEVSGLCNGDALRAMWDSGIRAAIGDNTWTHMLHPGTAYRMRRTTTADNGFDGMGILPRWSSALYFDCSTPEELAGVQSRMYPPPPGAAAATAAEIVAADARRAVLQGLMPLRMDGFMFHQANMRINPASAPTAARRASAPGRSLVMAWTEAVLGLLHQYVQWPVRSLSLDDVHEIYATLEDRDRCQITYTLSLARPAAGGPAAVTGVTLSSAAPAGSGGEACGAPLTVPDGVEVAAGPRGAVNARPRVGAEPRVFLVKLPRGGSAAARLTGPFAWGK